VSVIFIFSSVLISQIWISQIQQDRLAAKAQSAHFMKKQAEQAAARNAWAHFREHSEGEED
jgi:hypothetical protein